MSKSPDPSLRFLEADRTLEIPAKIVDELVDANHVVRVIWDYCLQLDLTPLYERMKTFEQSPGRPPYDPRVLFSLWLYATLQRISSARELERKCHMDNAFQWIAGGLRPGYHVLSDFRVQHVELLDELLTQSIAVLRTSGLPVNLDEVAQDGVRVRASAGAASFRSPQGLAEQLELAHELVLEMRGEFEHHPLATSRRQHAARQRAARERLERVEQAIAQLPAVQKMLKQQHEPTDKEIQEIFSRKDDDDPPDKKGSSGTTKGKRKKKKKRSLAQRRSTTDPDARVMKMADGGFRPAYNIQYAVDAESRVVVGVDVSQSGSDMGRMPPMVEQLQRRYPDDPLLDYLVDGGFVRHEDITALAQQEITVLAPVRKRKNNVNNEDRFLPQPGDSAEVIEWRQRMSTYGAKEQYKTRAASVELVNAQARNHGLQLLPVRGILKALAVALWHALAHNLTVFRTQLQYAEA